MTTANIAVRGNVLVVEDDPDCRDLILAVLETEGYLVKEARSRDAALLAIRQYRYDHVIVDVVMPGMSIQEFIEKIPAGLASRIIIISALVNPKETAERMKVKTWLRKPFNPDDLIDMMNQR